MPKKCNNPIQNSQENDDQVDQFYGSKCDRHWEYNCSKCRKNPATYRESLDNRANLPDDTILNCRKCLSIDYQIGHPEYYFGKTYEELQKELFAHQWNYHSDFLNRNLEPSTKTTGQKSKLDLAIEKAAKTVAIEMKLARQMYSDTCKNGECD